MASEAEVDLVISTANALPELERDLQRIVTQAEASADDIDLQASLDRQESVANLITDLDAAIQAVQATNPEIDISAALDAADVLEDINNELDSIIILAESHAEAIRLDAELDADIARLDAEIAALSGEIEEAAPAIDIPVDIDRDRRGARAVDGLGRAFTGLIPSLGRTQKLILAVGTASLSALPAIAALATAVEQVAPAAALAAPSLLAVALAGGAVKLAMVGVGDAVKSAFDPETSPEELTKALEDLAPAARKFVLELQRMRGGLKDIQQSVQQNFFANFDVALRTLGDRTLPIFARALNNASLTLNQMGHEVASAALELGNNGTLGRALSSANIGLLNLVKVPGQVTTAFGQLAAAAGPAFERLTRAAGDAATGISKRLAAAFESGALEDAIDNAVSALAQLGRSVGNIFEGLGNIFATVSQAGGGLFATLEKVTQAFADVTATKGFQDALKALVQTASTLVGTFLPLLSTALQALGPVFQAIGPPLEILIKALGDALGPVITALSPVLVALGLAFGRLVGVITPFIDLASKLLVALLPALVPLFDAIGASLNAMIPFAKALADNLAAQLVPIFTKLATEVLPKILPPLVELSTKIFPILTDILVQLGPSLTKLGEAFGEVLVALAPLIVQLAELTIQLIDRLMPVIQPIIDVLVKLIEIGLGALVFQIATIVIPAIKVLVDLLRGDFSSAWKGIQDIVANVSAKVGELITAMKNKVMEQLRALIEQGAAKVRELRDKFAQGFQGILDKAREIINQLPGIITGGLANAGNLLVGAGANIVQGLISGMRSKLGQLKDLARQVADTVAGSVKGFLGIQSPSRVMMQVGDDTMEGFRLGIANAVPDLRKELQGVAALAPSFALPNGQTLSLPQASADAPVVQVFLGNELLNGHVDARISQSNQSRDLLAVRGTRR